MPNVMTTAGLFQQMALGFVLLLIFFLRARRYGRPIMPRFAMLWVAACIGAAMQGVIAQQQELMAILPKLLVAALAPMITAIGLQGWLDRRRRRR